MNFKYWAFISYSHTDESIGKRVHKYLEKLPLSKRKHGVKKLFPIFRDKDELPTSSDLGSQLNSALLDSKYLLVICTPTSAKSKWVNEEIRKFSELGRASRIIAFIPKDVSPMEEIYTPEMAKIISSGDLEHRITWSKGGLRTPVDLLAATICGTPLSGMRRYQSFRRLRKAVIWMMVPFITAIALFLMPTFSTLLFSHKIQTDDAFSQVVKEDYAKNAAKMADSEEFKKASKDMTKIMGAMFDAAENQRKKLNEPLDRRLSMNSPTPSPDSNQGGESVYSDKHTIRPESVHSNLASAQLRGLDVVISKAREILEAYKTTNDQNAKLQLQEHLAMMLYSLKLMPVEQATTQQKKDIKEIVDKIHEINPALSSGF
ncbi:toll/interleukin-1 receptor domain-containing protein [Gilvimarinus sp. DA14]|uniref:toll/interleukin-1 receptor domain-containing protein n=1 Tax=Gilvimarinus sp. DA14 TaxID=2956798 RepID=UPI0020B7B0C1|nr:toll/interleukin-1 receptor domain-containing protein [Gilvimarinus sp. DA14]UTF59001.1 toll/interleukin-1 receptor domain-containing protein [Gilvimarinus sp. DA14]